MFKRLMNWVGEAASSVAAKYALRASVVVPLLLAAGFAIAGLAVYLTELFGPRDAYFMLAAGFAACGLITALAVRWHEDKEEADAQEASEAGSAVATAAKVAISVPAAIIDGTSKPSGARNGWVEAILGWPLLIAAIGLVIVNSAGRRADRHF